jgi:hypothetical protein
MQALDSPPPMTPYFRKDVLAKRPYIRIERCLAAIENPASKETQPDGRIRHWFYVEELGKYLRVVTLPDGTTLHNAFPGRRFTP